MYIFKYKVTWKSMNVLNSLIVTPHVKLVFISPKDYNCGLELIDPETTDSIQRCPNRPNIFSKY